MCPRAECVVEHKSTKGSLRPSRVATQVRLEAATGRNLATMEIVCTAVSILSNVYISETFH
jgi:hypothetical protein